VGFKESNFTVRAINYNSFSRQLWDLKYPLLIGIPLKVNCFSRQLWDLKKFESFSFHF